MSPCFFSFVWPGLLTSVTLRVFVAPLPTLTASVTLPSLSVFENALPFHAAVSVHCPRYFDPLPTDASWPFDVTDEFIARQRAPALPPSRRSCFARQAVSTFFRTVSDRAFFLISYSYNWAPSDRAGQNGGQWLSQPSIPRATGRHGPAAGGPEHQPEDDSDAQ